MPLARARMCCAGIDRVCGGSEPWTAVIRQLARHRPCAAAAAAGSRLSHQRMPQALRQALPQPHQRQSRGLSHGWSASCAATSAADHVASPQQAADTPQPAEPQQQQDAPSREQHNRLQAAAFDHAAAQHFLEPLPEDVQQKLRRIVAAAPTLGPDSRVIDVGSGTGALIPFLQERGVRDILAVDLSQPMLDALVQRFPNPGSLGNEPGVRTWCGDIVDLPAFQGPADAVFFNAVLGNVHDQHAALWAACRQLRSGGCIVLSHPLGRDWCAGLSDRAPEQVPHRLPDAETLAELIHDLPLRVIDSGSSPDNLYLRVLQVPDGYAFPLMTKEVGGKDAAGAEAGQPPYETRSQLQPVVLKAEVVTGFGRGSRDLGFPTANLDPPECHACCCGLPGRPERLVPREVEMPCGVFFGWAQLQGPSVSVPEPDLAVHPMVMNIGVRPTMGDQGGLTLEVHVFDHEFSGDFYGRDMAVAICGFLRPELKFGGLPALMAQIRTDIGIARAQLQQPALQQYKQALPQ